MYRKAINQIQSRREDDLARASDLFENALKRSPELFAVEKSVREAILEDAKSDKKSSTKTQKLLKSRDEILFKMGISKKDLEPPYRCKACSDTGLSFGEICSCAKNIALNEENNIGIPLYNFENFNPTLFEEKTRKHNITIFSNAQKIISAFPNGTKRFITILGSTGTGKTFLAGCAASEFLKKGFSVTAITAFDFVNRTLAYHTTFDADKLSHLSPLLDSDLLIIDDLGTEPILKNVTLEYLFLVINERMRNNCLTLINSNLDINALKSRYDERIYSRISDANTAYITMMTGEDIRFKKR